MSMLRRNFPGLIARGCLMAAGLLAGGLAQAVNLDIHVVDGNGVAIPGGFRYLVQENTTYAVDPSSPAPIDQQLALNFHRSHHPLALNNSGEGVHGTTDNSDVQVTGMDQGRYFVSVLPHSGYAMGGGPAVVGNGQNDVTITVEAHPIPTAQISVYLFHDCFPLNGAPDLPEEEVDLATGRTTSCTAADGFTVWPDWSQFSVVVEEPAGKYGANGGPLLQDAFGNPLGTAYDLGGNPLSGPGGCPAREDLTCADGTLTPNDDGTLTIKNLAPGKYGILVTPPTSWVQTATIEGTPVIDAWVKANEPPYMVEFGLPGPHVFIGFIQEHNDLSGVGGATVQGAITDMHMSRPIDTTVYSGRPFPQCWIAINEGIAGINRYAGPCDADSNFSISNVPAGTYEMKVFDKPLDVVIATMAFTVDPGGTCNGGQSCDFGEVPVFNWFNRLTTYLFNDDNQNGFWDDGETNIGAESGPVNVRWRDGTVYQSFPTDFDGLAPFDEHFPWFHWMVAEVGFTNKKATGATVIVDAGGEVKPDGNLPDPPAFNELDPWVYPSFGELTPQPQTCTTEDLGVTLAQVTDVGPDGLCYTEDDSGTLCGAVGQAIINCNTGNNLSRTEVGPVLLEAFQGFLGQTNYIHFGKTDYLVNDFGTSPITYVGENGGISGVVFNTVTRAENDPQLAVGEGWEPGVPRVQVNLYADGDIDSPVLGEVADGGAPPPCDVSVDFPCGKGDIDWNTNGTYEADDNIIDDVDGNGCVGLADVDNHPVGNFPGPEDVNRDWQDDDPTIDTNYCTEVAADDVTLDLHDAIAMVWSDSWDDSLPTGCQGVNDMTAVGIADDRCFDGMRNWNQVRPGVFDGGYAFAGYDATHLAAVNPTVAAKIQGFYDYVADAITNSSAPERLATLQLGLLPGDYIVEGTTPPGYETLREHHKNVDFGDDYTPSHQAIPPACVGPDQEVPPYFAIATKNGSGYDVPAGNLLIAAADAEAPFAGAMRPVCDLKKVPLSAGQNAASDFFLVAPVPVAANVTGIILNDLANEFNPNSPNFGEKYAPPLLPVGFYDWNGKPVNRVYADEYGRYNAMLPSTWNVHLPQPSGVSPAMYLACMNDAGPIPDPNSNSGGQMIDPFFNPAFSQFCYTFQYVPGSATYLDTPVVPVAAFASPVTFPVDCEQPNLTPMIASVERAQNGGGAGGPFVVTYPTLTGGNRSQRIVIRSKGTATVPNPEYNGTNARTITRDYSFAGSGNEIVLTPLAGGTTYTLTPGGGGQASSITVDVPRAIVPGDYQVTVRSDYGNGAGFVESPIGVTLTVGVCQGTIGGSRVCDGTEVGVRPNAADPFNPGVGETYAKWEVPGDYSTIQAAIDAVDAGDLILVAPGEYDELVVMHKPVRLQGWGADEVVLNARQVPTEKIQNWSAKIDELLADGSIDPLPGQEATIGGVPFPALGVAAFLTEQGAGVFIAGNESNPFGLPGNQGSRFDGFSVVGASQGGGIVVNGYVQDLNIGNNLVTTNSGFFGGGIRVGHPGLSFQDGVDLFYTDAQNDRITIHHNLITKDGNTSGWGGGISLHTGADQYLVEHNFVCGNFSAGGGGGIAHLGRSDGGVIRNNQIVYNESFSQASSAHGGGLFFGGETALQPTDFGGTLLLLSDGTGNVVIDSNLIHGNMAGAGDGGAIAMYSVNGVDVSENPADSGMWWSVNVINNMITNNVSGLAGAVTLQDALEVSLENNTVAHNDSTATAALAFTPGFPGQSNPLPAGIVSRLHGPDMATLLPSVTIPVNGDAARELEYLLFSDPDVGSNIVFGNRSFFWLNYSDGNPANGVETGLFPANCTAAPAGCNTASIAPYSDDLAVLDGTVDTGELLYVNYSLLTDNPDNQNEYGAGNALVTGNLFTLSPMFVNAVFNEGQDGINQPEFTVLQTAGAFDEGGNFIQVAFGPLTLVEPGTNPGDRVLYDYHIAGGSPAEDAGNTTLGVDFDGDTRAAGENNSDIGADELP